MTTPCNLKQLGPWLCDLQATIKGISSSLACPLTACSTVYTPHSYRCKKMSLIGSPGSDDPERLILVLSHHHLIGNDADAGDDDADDDSYVPKADDFCDGDDGIENDVNVDGIDAKKDREQKRAAYVSQKERCCRNKGRGRAGGRPSPDGFTLTWWGGLLHRKMETIYSQHPTGTPRQEHPNMTTPACKPNLNTAPTCATFITNTNTNPHLSNSTSSNPYIIPMPTPISTPSTSAAASPPPSTALSIHDIMSIFLLRQGEFL
jgi:hypothetical protein